MKKKIKKNKRRKNWIKKKSKSSSILPVLFVIALLSLFSETIRTLPAGAKSEKFIEVPFELPNLNSTILEKKITKNVLLSIKKQNKNQESEINDFLIEENFTTDNELIVAKVEIVIKKWIISNFKLRGRW